MRGQCDTEPRLIGFRSCRTLLVWPVCSRDFYRFLVNKEHELIKLSPKTWEAETALEAS